MPLQYLSTIHSHKAGSRTGWLLLLILAIGLPCAAAARERLALVIGNADYADQSRLFNTLNDARDIAAKLEQLGFEVTKQENADYNRLNRAVNEFVRKARGSSGVALIYYSGHGLQVGGQNYLLPVDAQIRDELDVPSQAVPVNRVLAGLGHRGARAVNLLILDACRNNPYKTSSARSVGDKGLARVEAPSGTLILYATKPGDTASDNPQGRNGLFTQHLLQSIDQPGVQVEDAFKQAAEQVFQASGQRQDPWMEGRIRGRFYFVPPRSDTETATGTRADPRVELAVWNATLQCGTAACYRDYLRQFPQGAFAKAAHTHLQAGQPAGDGTADTPAPGAGQTWREPHTGMEFVAIPEGCFQMGSPDGEAFRSDDERQHRVCVDRFLMGKYEVTFEQYDRFAEATGRPLPNDQGWGRGRRPVINVSWGDAKAYADWLAERSGGDFRLPTEAEWEYAARAGEGRSSYWDNEPEQACTYANVADSAARRQYGDWTVHACDDGFVYTSPAGRYRPNRWGLHDMLGNVWEWTCSAWARDFNGEELHCVDSGAGVERVVRGGSWANGPALVRLAVRGGDTPEEQPNANGGFRIVRGGSDQGQ